MKKLYMITAYRPDNSVAYRTIVNGIDAVKQEVADALTDGLNVAVIETSYNQNQLNQKDK